MNNCLNRTISKSTNYPSGSGYPKYCSRKFLKRLGVPEGKEFIKPIIEFYYKDDQLDDPFINEEHIYFLQLAKPEEISELKAQALAINEILTELFAKVGLVLVDFKLEFGRSNGQICLRMK